MSYRSDEELAIKRRNKLLSEYQGEGDAALTLLGSHYSKRVASRVFAFLSPALLLLIPLINRWSQAAELNHKKSATLIGLYAVSFLLSLMLLGLVYLAAQLIASGLLRRRLYQYLSPSQDAYRDLARLAKRPLDFVKESVASIDYVVPLVLLVVIIPPVVYVNQFLVGFVPFCPDRSQEGLGALSVTFLVCAGLVHLHLLAVLYRLIRRTRSDQTNEGTSHQPGLPLVLGAFSLALGFQVPRLLPWFGGLASNHNRAEPETLYIANAFLFMLFIVIFELCIYNSLRNQASLPQEESN